MNYSEIRHLDYRTLGSFLGLAEIASDPAENVPDSYLRKRLIQIAKEYREKENKLTTQGETLCPPTPEPQSPISKG